jgi:hypothetical protein
MGRGFVQRYTSCFILVIVATREVEVELVLVMRRVKSVHSIRAVVAVVVMMIRRRC